VPMTNRFLDPITDVTPLVSPTGASHSLSIHKKIIAAFSLSSGTVGAAMSSSLSKIRSVALSYGTMVHPTPEAYFDPAHNQGCRIINHLWNNWGEDECGLRDGEIDLYTVNIPLIEQILGVDGLKVCWTRLFRNSYGQLFKNVSGSIGHPTVAVGQDPPTGQKQTSDAEEGAIGSLLFKWSPNMDELISPHLYLDSLPVGSDTWAIHQGLICVTPLRASFGEPPSHVVINEEDILWKVRL
jgi:tubulin---tyrosine ligase